MRFKPSSANPDGVRISAGFLKVHAAEIVATTTNPNALFMAQVAKLPTDPVDGFLRAKKSLVTDRDAIFSEDFRTALKAEGVRALRSPSSAPNCDAFAERFVGTVRRERLGGLLNFYVRRAA